MGGGTFILLKVGQNGPESAKQVEIRLANLLKILRIYRRGVRVPCREPKMLGDGCADVDFCRI
jgi:hypothetical protein